MPDKKRRERDRQFVAQMRTSRIALARAIVEEGLTGERKRKALERISEAENREAKR